MAEKIYRLFRWTEKYTKTDMVYLARGSFWVILGQILTSLLSFGLLIMFANLLSKETYGLYRYTLSLIAFLNIFTLTGMNQAVSQAVANNNNGALRISVKYQLRWNTLMMLASFVLSIYYFINKNSDLGLSLLILGIFTPLTNAFNTYGAYLGGKKEFRLNNIFSVISTFIYVLGMAVILVVSQNIIWLIIIYSLSTFLSTLIFYIITLNKFNLKSSQEESNKEFLKYGKELTFIGLIGPIVSQIDKIILSHFWGVSQLAVYSLATAIPDRVISFIKDWVNIGFPKLATRTHAEINKVFFRRILEGLLIGILFAVAYILVAPYVFKIFLPKYFDTIFYSQVLAISVIFAIPNRYISLLLTAQKMSKIIFMNSLIQNIIRLLLYVVLGIYSGVFGLILAYIINSFVSMIINIFIWKLNSNKE